MGDLVDDIAENLNRLNISAFNQDFKKLMRNWHEKFYNCIPLGDVQHLEALTEEFLGMCRSNNNNLSEDLDCVLAEAYEELRLKNVPISDNMQTYVENKLVNLRFYHKKGENVNINLQDVKNRIGLINEMVKLLEDEYFNISNKIDEKFLFLTKFIALNLHVLKRLIKSTYNELPWEEMEFLLVYFYGKHMKRDPMCYFPLQMQKLLRYLIVFNELLQGVNNSLKNLSTSLPNHSRKEVKEIICRNEKLREFYNDYEEIKDCYSLTIISKYMELTEYDCFKSQLNLYNYKIDIELEKSLHQLIIERALSVTGEYLKNTLESPHMSEEISSILQSHFNGKVKELMVCLRNSLCHLYFHDSSNRETMCSFIGVDKARQLDLDLKGDLSNFRGKVNDILTDKKIKQVHSILKDIAGSDNLELIREYCSFFSSLGLDKLSGDKTNIRALNQVKQSINKLKDLVKDTKAYEQVKLLAAKAMDVVHSAEGRYLSKEMAHLQSYLRNLVDNIKHGANIANIKTYVYQILDTFYSADNEDEEVLKKDLKDVYCIVKQIRNLAQLYLTEEDFDVASMLAYNVFYYAEVKSDRVDDVEQFMEEVRLKVEEKQVQTEIQSVLHYIKPYIEESNYGLLRDKKLALEKLRQLKDSSSQLSFIDKSELESLLFQAGIDGRKILMKLSIRNWEECANLLHKNLTLYLSFKENIRKFLKTGEFKSVVNSFEKCFLIKQKGVVFNDHLKKALEKYSVKQTQKVQNILDDKFATLEKLLGANLISGVLDVNQKVLERKNNKLLIQGLEKLLLDITSYLEEKLRCIDNNQYGVAAFLDKCIPTLVGRQLRNHIAHGNALVNILYPDPCGALVSNAVKLCKEYKQGAFTKYENRALLKLKDLQVGQPLVNFNYLKERYRKSIRLLSDKKNMFLAAEKGKISDINRLVKRGADLNARDMNGWTIFHYAAKGGSVRIAKLLNNNENSDLNAKDVENRTPVQISAIHDNKEFLNLYLNANKGVVMDYTTIKGDNLLHFTAEGISDDGSLIKYLLSFDKGKQFVNNKNCYGMTPLHLSAFNGHVNIVKTLIANGAEVNAGNFLNQTPLHLAVSNNHLNIVFFLVKCGADVNIKNYEGFTPLTLAVIRGYYDIVCYLLKVATIDIFSKDVNRETVLHTSAKYGCIRITDKLINYARKKLTDKKFEKFINLKSELKMTPLNYAVRYNHCNIVDTLLKHAEQNSKKLIASSSTSLQMASLYGFLAALKRLLKVRGININLPDTTLKTPLHYAALKGHSCIASELLEYANETKTASEFEKVVNARDSEGFTPLHLSALRGHLDVIKVLTDDKVTNIIAKTYAGETVFHFAAANGNNSVLETLLTLVKGSSDGGKLILAKCSLKRNALHFAASYGCEDAAKTLLKFVKENFTPEEFKDFVCAKCSEDLPAIFYAAFYGYDGIVAMLQNEMSGVAYDDNYSPLHIAVEKGYLNVVKVINLSCINTHTLESGYTPLHLASQNGFNDIVEYLIENNANINAVDKNGATALHKASKNNHWKVVKTLLSKVAPENYEGETVKIALYLAAVTGRKNVVQVLLDNSNNVNLNCEGSTLLHTASKFGHKEVINILCHRGADLNMTDDSGCTPLHLAVEHGQKEVADILLNQGASINIKNNQGWTPLHLVFIKNRDEREEANLQIMYRAEKGESPENVVRFLLDKGAEVNSLDASCLTPLFYAIAKKNEEAIKLLLNRGGNVRATYFKCADIVNTLSSFPSLFNILKATVGLFDTIKNRMLSEDEKVTNFNKYINTGAIIGATDNYEGVTLLHYAVQYNYGKVVDLLLEKGIDFTRVTINKGNGPLHLAAAKGYVEMVKNLLKYAKKLNLSEFKAFINAKTSIHGNTALHLATQTGYNDVVQVLLKNGADPSIPNKDKNTALCLNFAIMKI